MNSNDIIDAVRLAKEFQKETKESLIGHYELQNNVLKGSWWIFENPTDFNFTCQCKFIINDRDFSFKFNLYPKDFDRRDPEDFRKTIYKKMLEQLAVILLVDFADESNVKTIYNKLYFK